MKNSRKLIRVQHDIAKLQQSSNDIIAEDKNRERLKRDIDDYAFELSTSKDIDGDMARLYPALRTHHPECLCPSCFQDDFEQDDTFTVYDHLGSPVIVDGLSSVIWNKEGYVRVQTGYCAVKFVDSERRWYLAFDNEISQDTIEAVAYANSRKR